MGWPRSYVGKILLVSFLGVHVPMIGAVAYVLLSSDVVLDELVGVFVALLLATGLGTALTWAALYGLLAPVREAARALRGYLGDRTVPTLPTRMGDEVGVLMAQIQESITRLDAMLDATQHQLSETTREHQQKFAMLSSMSHEFRTPLNHMIGFAEMMSAEALGPIGSEKYRGYATDIGASGNALLETLQTLLELSESEALRSEGGNPFGPIEVAGLIRKLSGLVHMRAQQSGVEITVGANAGSMAFGDERGLKQAFLHGLQSAIQMVPGGGTIAVDIAVVGDSVVARVDLPRGSGWRAGDPAASSGWRTDDVPHELRHDGLPTTSYSSANDLEGDAIASLSPTALRLSLVRSLTRAGGGEFALGWDGDAGVRQLTFTLPVYRKVEVPIAA